MSLFSCCGDRADESKAPKDDGKAGAAKDAKAEKVKPSLFLKPRKIRKGTYATLVVKVDCGEQLICDETHFNIETMKIENTQDPFVRLCINDDEAFGNTAVKWNSTGSPRWDESFSAGVVHPQSYLCVTVMDDDPVFGHDNAVLANHRNTGFIEIPLWELPRNQVVKGWFTLNHPDLAHGDLTLADRRKTVAAAKVKKAEADKHLASQKDLPEGAGPTGAAVSAEDEQTEDSLYAGRVKLELLLQTTPTKEFFAEMQPAPQPTVSLPALDVPGFLEDVQEVKRLIMERLIVRPIKVFMYAISWEDPRLSFGLLCWHIFVCYYKTFVSASLWIVLLLCFWHDIPEPVAEKEEDLTRTTRKRGTGEFISELAKGGSGMFLKPLEGAKKDGIFGLATGVKEGFQSNIKHTTSAWQGMASDVKGVALDVQSGIGGTLDGFGMHGIGLSELQHILLVKPTLAQTIRGLQPTAKNARNSLQGLDDKFYWANVEFTKKIVSVLAACLLISVLFHNYMGVVSGYGWLIVGSLVILAKSKVFNAVIATIKAIISVWVKKKTALAGQTWFELIDK